MSRAWATPHGRKRQLTSANNEQQPFAMSGRLGPIARKNGPSLSIISCFSCDNQILGINIAEILRTCHKKINN